MFITGPDVIKTVTHEEVTKEDLGGARTHATRSGVAHFAIDADEATLPAPSASCCAFLPQNNADDPPPRPCSDDRLAGATSALDDDRPGSAEQALRHEGRHPRGRWTTATSSRCTEHFAREHRRRLRAAGRAGRWASSRTSRRMLAGVLDIDASVKAARFVRFCDAFNIPLVTFVDVPGFLPGTDAGVRRHHHARREAALRVRRGDGAEGHGHHAQGVRRRLRRDGVEAHPRRRELRVARPPRSR